MLFLHAVYEVVIAIDKSIDCTYYHQTLTVQFQNIGPISSRCIPTRMWKGRGCLRSGILEELRRHFDQLKIPESKFPKITG